MTEGWVARYCGLTECCMSRNFLPLLLYRGRLGHGQLLLLSLELLNLDVALIFDIDASHDWALVRLARPACSKGVLPVRVLPIEQIWVNPDCGLKTRRWEEVKPALTNLVAAAQSRRSIQGKQT